MSARSLSLKSPGLIAAVVVMGVAVTVLNIRTFGGKHQATHGEAARTQAYPVLPGDLGEMVRLAGQDMRGETTGGPDSADGYAAPARDPFREAAQRAAASPTRSTRRPARKSEREFVCSAVLLGGERPLAVLGGKARTLGERVGGWTVAAIGAGGVELQDDAGRTRTLKVAPGTAATMFSVTGGGMIAPPKDGSERMEP